MLSILINDLSKEAVAQMGDYESRVSDYFDDDYDEEWFQDEYVRMLIRDIDKTEVRDDGTLYNEWLGSIVVSQLSTGVKGLILLYKTDIKINGDRLGDNCWKHVVDIAKTKDIGMVLRHIPILPDDFDAFIINTGEKVDKKGYILTFVRLVE